MKTMNYEIFKFSPNNRPIQQSHVKTIVNSIMQYGYFNSKPITVTPDMIISDGQHRFAACKSLGLPVVYEIDNISHNDSMVVLNTTSNIWRLNEFIEHYAKRDITCYVELKDFCKSNPNLGVSNCINIYTGTTRSLSKEIRAGKILKKSPKCDEIYELIIFFKDNVKFYSTSKFVRAIVAFLNEPTTEKKHIDKLKANCFGFIQCATTEQYITMFNKYAKKKS